MNLLIKPIVTFNEGNRMLLAQVTEFAELIRLLPNGAATAAVIAVVVLFLRQQDKMNDVLNQITEKFNAQTAANQKAFQEQINELAKQYYVNQKVFQDQIQSLMDAHIKISRETITALKTLEATVTEVKNSIRANKP
jgi:hypothetical protein